MARAPKAVDVDDYISRYSGEVGRRLENVRRTIRKVAPGSSESISYDIPTIRVDGRPLLYFAAFASHLSVYPAPRGAPGFADELAQYAGGKGTVQFPHDAPVPYELVKRMALFHLERIRGAKKAPAKKSGTKSAAKKAGHKAAAKRPARRPA